MLEEKIRPKAVFDEYLALAQHDADELRLQESGFVDIPCPACAERGIQRECQKWGYRYAWCSVCDSLYCTPRPSRTQLAEFYLRGESVRHWSSTFYKKTAEARREAIIGPRARLAAELSKRLPRKNATLADIGCGAGVFLEEVSKTKCFGRIIGIEPAKELAADTRAKGFEVVEKYLEEISVHEIQADLLTSFEVLEHLFLPLSFLTAAFSLIKPGGAMLCTTLVSTGFDIALLGGQAKNVYPPHHINLLSLEGVKRLFERAGFNRIDLETPGELDVQIVRRMREADASLSLPPFVDYLLRERGEEALTDLQQFLKKHRLSSHCRVLAYKNEH